MLSIALTLVAFLMLTGILALALIQWEAAQRRELLYFHLTLEKPGSGYFRSARADRELYSRMATAALILCGCETAILMGVLRGSGPAFEESVPWVQTFGLAFLAYGLLFPVFGKRAWPTLFVVGVGVVAVLSSVSAALGQLSLAGSLGFARVCHAGVTVGAIAAVRKVPEEYRLVTPRAFALWLVGPILSWVWADQAAMAVFFGSLAFRLFREMVEHGETLESDHHRMQRQREVIVSFLERIGSAYSDALDLEQLLRIVALAGVDTTGAGAGAIFLIDPRTHELQMRAVHGPFPPLYRDVPATTLTRRWEELARMAMRQRFALGEGVVGQVAAGGRPMRIADAREAGILVGSVCDPVRRHPMLLVPLVLRNEVLGVMAVLNRHNVDEFSENDQVLLSTLAEQAAFYIDNARMVGALAAQERVRRELQIARDIQHLLLPAAAPEVPGFDVCALSRPALEMGGDYHDFFWVAEGQLGIVVADVSGKGVPAALTMAMLRTVMRTHAVGNLSVSDTLVRANVSLCGDLRLDTFITMFYGILDVKRRTLTWARAGHEPTLALRGGAVETRTPSGAALGVLAPADFGQDLQVEVTTFSPGDAVMIYTDGITEAMNSEDEEFGMARFLQTVRGTAGMSSAQQVQRIEESVRAFVGDAPQQDDITLVVLTA